MGKVEEEETIVAEVTRELRPKEHGDEAQDPKVRVLLHMELCCSPHHAFILFLFVCVCLFVCVLANVQFSPSPYMEHAHTCGLSPASIDALIKAIIDCARCE